MKVKTFIPGDLNKTGGILSMLSVTLCRNINTNRGLVNVVKGILRITEWPELRTDQLETRELPSSVLVEFRFIILQQ